LEPGRVQISHCLAPIPEKELERLEVPQYGTREHRLSPGGRGGRPWGGGPSRRKGTPAMLTLI